MAGICIPAYDQVQSLSSVMGRVCPAPCEDGCNRNELEEAIGINAVEQYVGDWALKQNLTHPAPGEDSGKKVAIVGGGCAGLTAAFFLRQKGHACTIFDEYSALGGMMVFGIPGYRTPRSVLEGEINRIIDMVSRLSSILAWEPMFR